MEKEKEKKQPEIVENIDNVSDSSDARFGVEESNSELMFQSFQKKKTFKKKILKIAGLVLVVVLTIIAGASVYLRNKNSQQIAAPIEQVQIEISQDKEHIIVNETGDVSREQIATSGDDLRGLAGKSENFQIRDIAIGGTSVVLAAETETLPLKVLDVRSEMLMTKDGKKMQVLVSWKTNKLAKSEVKYSKDGKGTEKSIKEYGYGFSHALVLNNLEQATRYVFTVSASDRSGNKSVSDALAVFTGSKPVSVFDLISNEMSNIFGWALKD